MKRVSHSKIKNCINQLRLTSVLLLVTLFLLISGMGWGQTVDFSASSTIVCSGSSVIFTDNSTGISALATYSWDFGTGASPSTLTGIGPHAVTYTGSGPNTVSLTITDGTLFPVTKVDYIMVNALPTVLITNPAAVCSPATVDLTAEAVTSGSTALLTYTYWTDALATVSYVTPAIATAGTYYIKGTAASGCYDIQPVTVTINPLPIPALTSSDTDNIFCAGTSVTFTAGGGTSYNFMEGASSVQSGSSATYTTSSLTNGLLVSVLVTDANGCTATSAGITNTVNAIPSANAGTDTVICKGGNIQLHAPGTGSILWAPAALVSNPDIADPAATPVTTTTFTVTLTDQFGCKNSDSIIIEVRENPVADAGIDQLLEYQLGTTMNAELAHDYERGLWALISGTGEFFDASNPQTSVDKLSLGENKFSWTVTNGVCPASGDTVSIIVYDIRISTLITPNMDGKNDYFILNGLNNMGKTELVIFDRRGAQVYKNGNYDNLWNGVDYNGNPLPDDTYFYVIKAEKGKSVSGFIVIRR